MDARPRMETETEEGETVLTIDDYSTGRSAFAAQYHRPCVQGPTCGSQPMQTILHYIPGLDLNHQ